MWVKSGPLFNYQCIGLSRDMWKYSTTFVNSRECYSWYPISFWEHNSSYHQRNGKLNSITMQNVGLNTSVQTWSKPFVWTFTSVFFFAHTFCFFVGILVAPHLFSSSSIVGKVCHPQNLTLQKEQGQNDIEVKECLPLGRVSIPPVPLEDTVISFRFPEPSNEVN